MPEGDTVHLTAARLHRALAGRRLLASEFRVPRFATADLTGQVVREVVARGKHLLLRTDAGVTLHSHLKMEGAWHLYRPGERWRGPGFQVRAVLRTQAWVAVGFRLAICELLASQREHEVVGHLGPDVLGPDWDLEEAVRRLRARPERTIGAALLDQRAIAGPGNNWKNEICFLRGVSPWTPVREIDDLEGMLALLKRMMEVNRSIGHQVTTGDTRRGRTRWVAERGGEPCLRCGAPIRQAAQTTDGFDRLTYWCPTCQPGPGPPTREAPERRAVP
ncbi:MAG TPA: DNA-formamidopyrimidine glycosylase family protein [Actinomycetes bacterium]|jgi:endonuclease-8|nr:DNA-formamidopyrimidine glycosylase family protein [Actinomycetes bacterium]